MVKLPFTPLSIVLSVKKFQFQQNKRISNIPISNVNYFRMIATLKLKKKKKKCRSIIQSLKNPIYEEYHNIKKKGLNYHLPLMVGHVTI